MQEERDSLALREAWCKLLSNAKGLIYSLHNEELQSLLQSTPLPNGLNLIPYPTKWLEPYDEGPTRLCKMAHKIFQVFKRNKWTIPEWKVLFECYGWIEHGLKVQVHLIRSSHVVLGFNGQQRENRNDYNCAGFNYIVVPHFLIDFSGPRIYKYVGSETKWQKAIELIQCDSWPLNTKKWIKIDLFRNKATIMNQYEMEAECQMIQLLTNLERNDVLNRRLLDPLPFVLQVLILDYGVPEI